MADDRIRIDPEERETEAVASLGGDLRDASVLEIGCGDGRLTRRYARRARAVLAIDRDEAALAAARRSLPDDLRDRVEFRCAAIGEIDLDRASFDLAILAWSL